MQLRIIDEPQIDPELDSAIKQNLALCYPDHRDIYSKTRVYDDNVPSYSVILQQGQTIIAHVAVMDRTISVGQIPLHIAGVANVSVLPQYRGKALSSQVVNASMEEAKKRAFDFGLLFTSQPVKKVYTRCGWQVAEDRKVIKTENGQTFEMPDTVIKMYYSLQNLPFPKGSINLQGKDW